MKLALVQCVNGYYSIVAEGFESEQNALVAYHQKCAALWNAPDVITAEVAIVDEQFGVYHGYKEYIHHENVEG